MYVSDAVFFFPGAAGFSLGTEGPGASSSSISIALSSALSSWSTRTFFLGGAFALVVAFVVALVVFVGALVVFARALDFTAALYDCQIGTSKVKI